MLRTRVGYCGGSKAKPSYYALGDNTEAISIDYDPERLSYGDLLSLFWNSHHWRRNSGSRQYVNAVFYRDETQRRLAEESRDALGSDVATEILPVGRFTYAEDYHQKYYLTRYREIRRFLVDTYPDGKSLADSTVATRLNAYLGAGSGRNWATFASELPAYGLPDAIAESLRTLP